MVRTRLLCIAQDFTRYDEHAVAQIDRNIELIRYRRYVDGTLLLEQVNVVTASNQLVDDDEPGPFGKRASNDQPISAILPKLTGELADVWEGVRIFTLSLGDYLVIRELKLYWAYRRIKNFASAEIKLGKGSVAPFLKVDPDSVTLEPGFSRDVRSIGHGGTGDLELTIRTLAELERAKPLIQRSYDRLPTPAEPPEHRSPRYRITPPAYADGMEKRAQTETKLGTASGRLGHEDI
jgi:predicted transport protein